MSNFAQDMAVKAAWGLSLPQWNQLRETDRAYYRQMVTTAPHFQENQ
jgi:hypothetical protein